jgi:hypothetical protein
MATEAKFFYANGLELTISVYDITFKFMRNGTLTPELAPTAGQKKSGVQPHVLDSFMVSMSPTHAKAILPGLAQAIAQYEAQFGVIPFNESQLEQISNSPETH